MHYLRWTAFLPVALVAIAAQGCGGSETIKKVPVTGTVTYEGKPLESGTISFYPQESRPGAGTAGAVIKGGKYAAPDVTPGKNKVMIEGGGGGDAVPKMGARVDMAKMKNMSPEKAEELYRQQTGRGSSVPRNAEGNNEIHDIKASAQQVLDIHLKKPASAKPETSDKKSGAPEEKPGGSDKKPGASDNKRP
jgi:hypothetical protein